MAKNSNFLICLLCFGFWCYLAFYQSDSRNDSSVEEANISHSDTIGSVACAKDLYRSIVGIREVGTNTGPHVDRVMASVGLDNPAKVKKTGNGYYWCAANVCWVLTECGIDNPKSGWAATVSSYNVIYKKGDRFPTHVPDDEIYVHGIYYSNLGRVGHTGFVDRIGRGSSVCIEGNTNNSGSRDGGGVESIIRPNQNFSKISEYGI